MGLPIRPSPMNPTDCMLASVRLLEKKDAALWAAAPHVNRQSAPKGIPACAPRFQSSLRDLCAGLPRPGTPLRLPRRQAGSVPGECQSRLRRLG